jgi:hypothetical protein
MVLKKREYKSNIKKVKSGDSFSNDKLWEVLISLLSKTFASIIQLQTLVLLL